MRCSLTASQSVFISKRCPGGSPSKHSGQQRGARAQSKRPLSVPYCQTSPKLKEWGENEHVKGSLQGQLQQSPWDWRH